MGHLSRVRLALAGLLVAALAVSTAPAVRTGFAADRPVEVASIGLAVAIRWEWPLRPRPPVVRGFHPPPQPWLPGHRGVDLGGRTSETVHAAGPGTVVYAGRIAGRGVVSVDHAGGLRTTYEPVTASVTPGDQLGTGDVIGTLEPGHVGCLLDACLHWGLRRGRTYLDPLLLVRTIQVRLKPL